MRCYLHASPHAVLYVGRLTDLAALTAAAPPSAPIFTVAPGGDSVPSAPTSDDVRPTSTPRTSAVTAVEIARR